MTSFKPPEDDVGLSVGLLESEVAGGVDTLCEDKGVMTGCAGFGEPTGSLPAKFGEGAADAVASDCAGCALFLFESFMPNIPPP